MRPEHELDRLLEEWAVRAVPLPLEEEPAAAVELTRATPLPLASGGQATVGALEPSPTVAPEGPELSVKVPTPTAATVRRVKRRSWWLAAGIAVVLVAAAALALSWRSQPVRPTRPAAPAPAAVAAPPHARVRAVPEVSDAPLLAPPASHSPARAPTAHRDDPFESRL